MTPVEFALWMNGAVGVLGKDQPPTPEQWKQIHDKLEETVGHLVATRLLEDATRMQEEREHYRRRQELEQELQELKMKKLIDQVNSGKMPMEASAVTPNRWASRVFGAFSSTKGEA